MRRNLLGMKGCGTPVEISQRIVSLEVGSGVACNFSAVEENYNSDSSGSSSRCAIAMS